jgi:hypothetical protein
MSSETQPQSSPNLNQVWLNRMLWCTTILLIVSIVNFAQSFLMFEIGLKSYAPFRIYFALVGTLSVSTWCVMTWKSNYVRKLAGCVFVLALVTSLQDLVMLTGAIPDTVFRLSSVTGPILMIAGPLYLALVFKEYDFRFSVWPLIAIAAAYPIIVIGKLIEVPMEMRFYPLIIAGFLSMLLGLVGWTAVFVSLKKARPSHKNVVMLS